MKKIKKQFTLIIILVIFSSFLFTVSYASANTLGQQETFYVDKNYDISGRTQITASLQAIGNYVYFYTDHFSAFSVGLSTATANNIGPNYVNKGDLDVAILRIAIHDDMGGDWLNWVNLTSKNTDDSDVDNVELWGDVDGNRAFSPWHIAYS